MVNTTAKKIADLLNFNNSRFFSPTVLKALHNKVWDAPAFGNHKIHTKALVIDPWSDNPKILVGTGNFSDESCTKNDENFLVIEGETRLAAIITTEFIRMWEHYKNRAFLNNLQKDVKLIENLIEDNSWSNSAYDSNSKSYKFRERLVFSGQTR